MVIISRTCPEFLARLFELEVPEIFDKTVRIVKVVRDPGHRSKIAVTTSDSRVDPVGACVGMRGNRVQAIVRELSNERIDIITWTEELSPSGPTRILALAEVKRSDSGRRQENSSSSSAKRTSPRLSDGEGQNIRARLPKWSTRKSTFTAMMSLTI
ncbi:MAG: hypothetical protein MZV70_77340 [Desulfobacterales bacterium]|nr:hypothetical protein [Desulfobacterales bacterium]